MEAGDTERLFLHRRTEVEIAANAPMKADEAEGVWRTTLGDITLDRQEKKLGGRFKDDYWDWELLGDIEKRTYSFEWKCDHPGQNQHGDGYFLFTTDSEFEGIIRHTPKKGEVRVVTGRKQPPKPQSEEGSLPTLGEGLAPDDDIFKRVLDSLGTRRPPTQPPGG